MISNLDKRDKKEGAEPRTSKTFTVLSYEHANR